MQGAGPRTAPRGPCRAMGGGRAPAPLALLAAAVAVAALAPLSGAAAGDPADAVTPIGPDMAIVKSTVEFSVPEDNSLPWAFVEGTVSNPVPGYPVIIQIYGGGPAAEEGVHFAQTPVGPDGSYEYRFRVLNVADGSRTSVFAGDYVAKIFKVVYLDGRAGGGLTGSA